MRRRITARSARSARRSRLSSRARWMESSRCSVFEGLLQEIDRAGLHGADARRHVPVPGDEHDGNVQLGLLQGSLQLEATLAGSCTSRTRHGAGPRGVGEKRLRRREGLDRQPGRAKQALEGLADVLIVVDHAHDGGVVQARKRLSVHHAGACQAVGRSGPRTARTCGGRPPLRCPGSTSWPLAFRSLLRAESTICRSTAMFSHGVIAAL